MGHYLNNHFLIATPNLQYDVNFNRSVIFIYQHDEKGAMGIIINKPIKITLGEVLKYIGVTTENLGIKKHTVMLGGPIAQEQGFIILPKDNLFQDKDPPLITTEDLIISTSKTVLQKIATTETIPNLMVALGYASWLPGQLEKEILSNAWLVAPYKKQLLFDIPFSERWRQAAKSIGVNLDRLSIHVGNA